MTSTATSYSRKLQREQMWEKLKNNSQKNNSAICQKTVDQQSKDKQKLTDRQPILLQGTVVVGFITCIKLDVGIQCSHQAVALRDSRKKKLKWRIKTKKMRPLGRRGKLRVKRT